MSDEKFSEATLILCKPDAVARGLTWDILSRFSNKGYKLIALKMVWADSDLLDTHYSDLTSKPFFPGLKQYMMSGPTVASVWEGKDVVKAGRTILGATNPLASAPGTVRGDYSIEVGRNVAHGSDSVESAKREIDLWFKKEEVFRYKSAFAEWLYE